MQTLNEHIDRMLEIASYDVNDFSFYKKNNINPDKLNWLGSGDFGEAYSTGDGRVLKITTSKTEYDLAKSMSSKNIPVLEGFVDIYDTDIVENKMMILMEEVDVDSSIEDKFYTLTSYLEEEGLPIQYVHNLDIDELDLDDEMINFINDIEDINRGYRYLGIEASDIRPENLGMDSRGKIKAFDIEDRAK